ADAKRDAKGADAKKADAKADAKQADAKNPDAEKPDTAGDAEAPTEPAEDAGPDEVKLAEVAKAIAAKPADADAILEQNGMDRPAFEAAMVTIAKDQWKTDLFLTAYQPPAAGG
ncbi:MAG TPA: hypothetical protein VG755_08580, partial [Nannocystaceae bacterium]|nr:hypothetical protein [Nannocystaceae bacterium]